MDMRAGGQLMSHKAVALRDGLFGRVRRLWLHLWWPDPWLGMFWS